MSEKQRDQGHGDDHRAWEDEVAAYAVGGLTATESAKLETHLEHCDLCRDRLRWLAPAVDMLPASVPQISPPPELRERIMGEARAEADPGPAPAPRPKRTRRLRLSLPRLGPALAATAAAAALGGGAVGYWIAADGGPESQTIAVEAIAPRLEADATLERQDGEGTLHVSGLPVLPDDQVYQVWLRDGEELQPSTVFVLDRNASAQAAIPAGLESAEEVLVTREPRGGSDEPTTNPLLRAELN